MSLRCGKCGRFVKAFPPCDYVCHMCRFGVPYEPCTYDEEEAAEWTLETEPPRLVLLPEHLQARRELLGRLVAQGKKLSKWELHPGRRGTYFEVCACDHCNRGYNRYDPLVRYFSERINSSGELVCYPNLSDPMGRPVWDHGVGSRCVARHACEQRALNNHKDFERIYHDKNYWGINLGQLQLPWALADV